MDLLQENQYLQEELQKLIDLIVQSGVPNSQEEEMDLLQENQHLQEELQKLAAKVNFIIKKLIHSCYLFKEKKKLIQHFLLQNQKFWMIMANVLIGEN